ncbi:DUF6896 domain-containing protein [Chondromyces apiculatus]|uniref:DUF6896 domain-containing protein n=1 Tax=Chondromyces apiculatus TaxID=51 RepID=UPI003522C492
MRGHSREVIEGSSKDAVQVVLEFCQLQRQLVAHFMDLHEPKDRERFSDVARVTVLRLGEQSWRCARHGAGISFKTAGSTVDAHVGLAIFADAIDGWRLLQFLESRGIASLSFEGESYPADEEEALGRLLASMSNAGILEKVPLRARFGLFRPVMRDRSGAA